MKQQTKMLTYKECKEFSRNLGLRNSADWISFIRTFEKEIPKCVPKYPSTFYKRELNGMYARADKSEFYDYEKAAKYIQKQKIKDSVEYGHWHSKNKPLHLPRCPERYYKGKGWKGYSLFLGTGHKIDRKLVPFMPFKKARKLVRSKKYKNINEYRQDCKNKKLPITIPTVADREYKDKGWTNWRDYLGTKGRTALASHRKFLTYNQAKKLVRKLKIKSLTDFENKMRDGKFPESMPWCPAQHYNRKQKLWEGWAVFTGHQNKLDHTKKLLSFKEAKSIVQKMGIKSSSEYKKLYRDRKLPEGMPSNPNSTYCQKTKDRRNMLRRERLKGNFIRNKNSLKNLRARFKK